MGRLDTGPAVVFSLKQGGDFFLRLLLLESGGNDHACMLRIAGKAQHIVNIILSKRKSEGCTVYTLRFLYDCDLLLFRRNQPNIKEGELSGYA